MRYRVHVVCILKSKTNYYCLSGYDRFARLGIMTERSKEKCERVCG